MFYEKSVIANPFLIILHLFRIIVIAIINFYFIKR